MQIITEYSVWWMLPAFLLALGLTLLLYWRERRSEFTLVQKTVLAILRFGGIFLSLLLLLHPMILRKVEQRENPLIIIAQDNSQSLVSTQDSTFMRKDYVEKLAALKDKLSGKYEVSSLLFGDKVEEGDKPVFSRMSTDISAVGRAIYEHYGNRNTGAVILATDGIFNRGINPLFSFDKLNSPIYAIALGDTMQHRDLSIKRLRHNKIAFQNNKTPLEISIHGIACKGEKVQVKLTHNRKLLFSKVIRLSGDNVIQKVKTGFVAKEAGLQYFEVSLSHLDNEQSYENNHTGFYLDVLASKEKILILYGAPHPDVSAIRRSLENSENYEVKVADVKHPPARTDDFNLIILHGLPSLQYPLHNIMDLPDRQRLPLFFILDKTTDIEAVNSYLKDFVISPQRGMINEVQASLNEEYSRFAPETSWSEDLLHFPPLYVPYGEYKTGPNLRTLLFQRVESLTTTMPLLSTSETEGVRTAILCGEGIWRWRMTDYKENRNFNTFDALFGKLVQYLALKEKRRKFNVSVKRQWREGEEVVFDAELYDDTYQPAQTNEMKLRLANEKGEQFNYAFVRQGKQYKANVGNLPAGKYTYRAETSYGGKSYSENGSFIVNPLNIEKINLQADHHLLYQLAKASGGKVFDPMSLDKLTDELLNNSTIKPTLRYENKYLDMLSYLGILLFILLLFFAEWFLRKRFGAI